MWQFYFTVTLTGNVQNVKPVQIAQVSYFVLFTWLNIFKNTRNISAHYDKIPVCLLFTELLSAKVTQNIIHSRNNIQQTFVGEKASFECKGKQ